MLSVPFDRASGIGGSDIAAILGISPWRSAFDVWLEKTRDPSWNPAPETLRMRLGKLLEPALREAYRQDHPGADLREHWSGGAFAHPIWHPNGIAYAHLDGTLEGGIWEGKTAGDDRDWQAGVPDYYEAQVRQYLAISEEPFCDLTVLILNRAQFRHFRIDASPDTDQGIVEIGERWWHDHIDTKRPPDIDGSEAAGRYLAGLNEFAPVALEAPPHIDEIGKHLAIVRNNGAQLGETDAEYVNKIKEAMTEAGVMRMKGSGWSVLWKPSKGSTKVAWEQVAASWRKSVEALREFAPGNMAQFFTDEALDAIVALYTTTGDPTHPFRFTVDDKEAT